MSLFWQELKKIWHPGIFVGIVLLGLIYYYMFPGFYIEHFSNGPSARAEFDLSVEWGRSMDLPWNRRSGRSWTAVWRRRLPYLTDSWRGFPRLRRQASQTMPAFVPPTRPRKMPG